MKKNPGRKERRKINRIANTKGFGKSDQFFWKRVAKRRAKKKFAESQN